MVDIAVKDEAAWVCRTHLADILLPVLLSDDGEEMSPPGGEAAERLAPVLLQQVEAGSPCVLLIGCSPSSSTCISQLLVVSEARTMEVYEPTGEYCGTVRGTKDVRSDRADRGPFYRKQLILQRPSSACEVKLLSLGGRTSNLVCCIVVGLRALQPCPTRGPGIDLQQVQCLVEEMGTNLCPGAQNLMDMVQFQQKNQTGSLSGFLPLLMGDGALASALARGVSESPATGRNHPQSADSTTPDSISSADDQSGVMSEGSTSPDLPLSDVTASREDSVPMSHAHITEMMSRFLKGPALNPELLPILQRVCGQVTQLRLDDVVATAMKEEKMRNGSWEFDSTMERRLEDMEQRLKEHMDRRLDALEQKLEQVLLSVSPLLALSHRSAGSVPGEAASGRALEQTTSPAAP